MPSRNRTRRNRQSGGAPTDAELETALMSVILDEYDYQRMVSYESSSIDLTKNYNQFVKFNKDTLKELPDTDKFVFLLMAKRVKSGKVDMIDLEGCDPRIASNLIFNKNKNLVFIHPR